MAVVVLPSKYPITRFAPTPTGGGPEVPTQAGKPSILPLSYALSSGLSLWPWSLFSACDGERRKGFDAPPPFSLPLFGAAGLALGLLLSRSTPASGPKWLLTSSGLTRLLTFGVSSLATNLVSPERFCAFGEV